LLTFVLAAGLLNLAVGGLMQVVVKHGSGLGLPRIDAATKIELIDAFQAEAEPGVEESALPEAVISLVEPMDEVKPENADHSAEFDHDTEREMRASKASDPGSARGTRSAAQQVAGTSPGGQQSGRPATPATPRVDGAGGADSTALGPAHEARQTEKKEQKRKTAPEDEDGARPWRDGGGLEPRPAAGSSSLPPGVTHPGESAKAPAPAIDIPSADSRRSSMREVFGGGGSAQAIEGESNGPRDDVRTIRHDFAGFFVRIRDQIVIHWDPNGAVVDAAASTRDEIHRRTRLTLLRVRLRKDGSVDRIWIDRSSGFDLLDEHAILAVRAASPFPNLPPGLQGEGDGKLVFSMEFRFTKSGADVVRMRP
jgi:TonB family protein